MPVVRVKGKADRLYIFVSKMKGKKLLGIPKLDNGTSKARPKPLTMHCKSGKQKI